MLFQTKNLIFLSITSWVWPIYIAGHKRDLQFHDLYRCAANDEAERVGDKLERLVFTCVLPYPKWHREMAKIHHLTIIFFYFLKRKWKEELKRTAKPNFAWAVVKTFLPEFIPFFFVFTFQECVVRLSQPIFLGRVLRYFEQPDGGEISRQEAILSAAGIVLCSAIFISVNHITLACALRIGFRMRVACTTLMYRKVGRKEFTS